jgi:hypothetical protein
MGYIDALKNGLLIFVIFYIFAYYVRTDCSYDFSEHLIIGIIVYISMMRMVDYIIYYYPSWIHPNNQVNNGGVIQLCTGSHIVILWTSFILLPWGLVFVLLVDKFLYKIC